MPDQDFRRSMVLGNVDDQWRRSRDIRGALRLTVPQVVGCLRTLKRLGLVESRVTPNGELRLEWRLTSAGFLHQQGVTNA